MANTPNSQRRTFAIAATGAVILLAIVAAGFIFAPVRTISGQVVDASTNQPVVGVVVKYGGQEIPVSPDGTFSVSGLRAGNSVVVEAAGYQPITHTVLMDDQVRLALQPRVLEGVATDASTGKPLAGILVSASGQTVQTDEQGKYRFVGIALGSEVVALAEGFLRQNLQYDGQSKWDLAFNPNALTIRAVDQYTGQPVEGAEVTDGKSTSNTDKQGTAQLKYLAEGAEVRVQKEGFAVAKLTFSGADNVEAKLRPDTVVGIVRDSKGQPVAGAAVSDGQTTVNTDAQGAFKLTGVPENAKLTVRASGLERQQLEVGQRTNVDAIELKPFAAKSLYLTYYGVGDEGLRNGVLELADKTEINAVTIDIKGDRGWLAYRSSVPLVQEIGAQDAIMIPDPRQFLAELKNRGVYTIARIVVFKDNPLATAKPHLAVMNSDTGSPWVDNEGLAWADGMREEVWDYNIALAEEAIDLGFDEVQFDYVRFPTDAGAGNSLSSIALAKANTMENRVAAISAFLEKASKAIHAKGGLVSADIFGYVVWRQDDMGIGQRLEDVAKHVDYVSPMVYPNLFWHGLPFETGALYGDQQAGLFPYEIVYESMKIAASRIGPEKLRPWLQYYDDYLTGKGYGAAEVEAQKRATYENGITGWLFWDPSNRFHKGGFAP